MEWVSGAILKAPAVVAGLDDVAMMGETIEQSRRHLRIAEHARPFAKGEIGRDDHRCPLVAAAYKVEQELSASLCEWQVTRFIQDDEVEAGKIIGEASLTAGPSFGLEPVDQIDGVEEPAARSGANAAARDRAAKRTDAASSGQRARHCQMRLAGAGRTRNILPAITRVMGGSFIHITHATV